MNFNDHKLECSSDNADVQMFLNKAQVKGNAMLFFHIGKNFDITHVSLLNEFQQKTDREVGTLTIDGNSDQTQAKNKIGPNTQLELTIRNLEVDQKNVLIQVRDIHSQLFCFQCGRPFRFKKAQDEKGKPVGEFILLNSTTFIYSTANCAGNGKKDTALYLERNER